MGESFGVHMAHTPEIISVTAQALGLPFAEVSTKVRRLRLAGHFVKETRSASSPRPTPEHVAKLLLGLMSGASSLKIAEAVDLLAEARWDNPEVTLNGDEEEWRYAASLLPSLAVRGHSAVDMTADLVAAARDNEQAFASTFKESYLALDQTTSHLTFQLEVHTKVPFRDPKPSATLEYLNEAEELRHSYSELIFRSQLNLAALDQIGTVLRRIGS
jgi:hypothetical protein